MTGGLILLVATATDRAAWSDSFVALEAELLALMPHLRVLGEKIAAAAGGVIALISGWILLRHP